MKKQLGFTLVESVVCLAIILLVVTGAGWVVFYTYKANNAANNMLSAINTIQVAGRWVSQDVQIANRTNLADGAEPINPEATPVSFYRTDYYLDPPVSSIITYTLSGGELRRDYDGQITIVARDISSAAFSLTSRTVTIAFNKSGQSKVYQVYLRPSWN